MNPFIGQLMLASFNFAPKGWAQCNGQLMPINQNQALFSVLGTYYGGNGIQTFALPNLQGRTPVGFQNGYNIGQVGGEDSHTLNIQEVPTHTHSLIANQTANTPLPTDAMIAGAGVAVFDTKPSFVAMNSATVAPAGGSQPHENRQPFLVMNWCIALTGIFPSQN